jgi:hypothetical protein
MPAELIYSKERAILKTQILVRNLTSLGCLVTMLVTSPAEFSKLFLKLLAEDQKVLG